MGFVFVAMLGRIRAVIYRGNDGRCGAMPGKSPPNAGRREFKAGAWKTAGRPAAAGVFFLAAPRTLFPCGGPPAQIRSEQVSLCLRACGGGIGEHEARTETEGETGGFQRVPAGGDVVDEVGLPER